MAQGKKSFILYSDLITKIDHLTTEEKGVLFQHLLEYVNDMNPVLEDRVLIGVWKPIEHQLKADLKLWEKKQEQRRKAGKRSAEVRKQKSTSVNERSIRSTDSTVNGNGNVNDNDIVSTIETIKQIDDVYEDFVDEVKKGYHQQWAEQTYMQLKLKKGTLTTLIQEFKSHLIRITKSHPGIKEFKEHLNNWLNNQDSLGKLNQYKTRKSAGAL